MRLVQLIRDPKARAFGDSGLDETLEAMRDEMRRFVEAEVDARTPMSGI